MENEQTNNQFFERVRGFSEEPINQIGPYSISFEFARGGQGIVYQGVDTRDQTRVAIKRAYGSGKNIKSNLVRGAELAAMLEHPYILPLLDLEYGDDTAWVITPWVDGTSLDKWCNDSACDVQSKIALFLKICEAVTHAHARGVIHRDLRPANILVRQDGRPCVLDFGIAKRVEGKVGSHTATQSELAGDLHFLAPELLRDNRAAADIRQDVYALGVILYTIFTGTHPLDRMAIGECVTMVSSGKLFDASIDHKLPYSMGAILRKATSSDLNARYPTVQEFVSDICDDQLGFPVRARTHTNRYLFTRFTRRNRIPILGGTVSVIIMLSVAAGLGGMIERERGLRASNTQTIQMYTNLILSVTPSREVGPTSNGLALLQHASDYIDSVTVGNSKDEKLAIADYRSAIASGYVELRRADKGVPHAKAALEIYMDLLGRDHIKTQATGIVWVNLLTMESRLDEAKLGMYSMVDDLGVDQLQNPGHLANMAMILSRSQNSEEALAYYDRYLELGDENSAEYISILVSRGKHLNRMGKPSDAIPSLERAHRMSSGLFGADGAWALESRLTMAKSYKELGRFEEVQEILSEILPKIERVFGLDDYRAFLANALLTVAEYETGFAQRAHDRASASLVHMQGLYPDEHWNVIQPKLLLARTLLALGRPEEVIDFIEPEMIRLESQDRVSMLRKYKPRYLVARANNDLGRYTLAAELLAPAMDLLTASLGVDHPLTLHTHFEYVRALAGAGEIDGLEEVLSALTAQFYKVFGSDHPYTQRVSSFAFDTNDIVGPSRVVVD